VGGGCGADCKLPYASGAFEAVDIVEPKKIARR
jgi:hypothetical protein